MTEAIYSWMRNLAYYYLFYSVIMNILPDHQYRSYIKDFMGVLLIILLLSPILAFFKMDHQLTAKVALARMEEDYKAAADSSIVLEEKNHDYQQYAYEKEIESQITQLLQKHELYVWDMQITLEGEEVFLIKRIYVLAGSVPNQEEYRVGEVIINPETESSEVINIKKELQEVYQMNPVNIIINIQE